MNSISPLGPWYLISLVHLGASIAFQYPSNISESKSSAAVMATTLNFNSTTYDVEIYVKGINLFLSTAQIQFLGTPATSFQGYSRKRKVADVLPMHSKRSVLLSISVKQSLFLSVTSVMMILMRWSLLASKRYMQLQKKYWNCQPNQEKVFTIFTAAKNKLIFSLFYKLGQTKLVLKY